MNIDEFVRARYEALHPDWGELRRGNPLLSAYLHWYAIAAHTLIDCVREYGEAVFTEIGRLLCVDALSCDDALRGWPHQPYTETEALEYAREVTRRLRDAQIWRQAWDEEAGK